MKLKLITRSWTGYKMGDEIVSKSSGGRVADGVAKALLRSGRAELISEPAAGAKKKRGRPPKAKEAKPDAPTDDTAEPDAD